MKKTLCMLCVLVLMLSACSEQARISTQQEQNYTQGLYKLTIKRQKLSNHCVGNDWSFSYTCDGKPIKSGDIITCPLDVFKFQSIQIEICEDDKIPDIATGQVVFGLADGGEGSTEITVIEAGGNYAGNTAVWKITCTVKLVGKQ